MTIRGLITLAGLSAVALATVNSAACAGSSAAAPTPTVPSPSSRTTGTPAPAAPGTTGAGGAGAASPFGQLAGGAGDLLTGTVVAASETSITINTQRGPLRLAVDTNTRVTRNAPATASDVRAGDNVLVIGERAESGAVNAVAITVSDEPIARGGQFAVRGDGRSFGDGAGSGSGFRRRDGTPGAGADGPIFQAGPADPGRIDRLVQQAVESGRLTPEEAAQLRSRLESGQGPGGFLQRGPGGSGGATQFGAPPVAGKVLEALQGTLTVETEEGPVQVTLTDATRIQRMDTPAPAKLTPGTAVNVAAQRGADGVVRATAIVIGDGAGTLRLGGGPGPSP